MPRRRLSLAAARQFWIYFSAVSPQRYFYNTYSKHCRSVLKPKNLIFLKNPVRILDLVNFSSSFFIIHLLLLHSSLFFILLLHPLSLSLSLSVLTLLLHHHSLSPPSLLFLSPPSLLSLSALALFFSPLLYLRPHFSLSPPSLSSFLPYSLSALTILLRPQKTQTSNQQKPQPQTHKLHHHVKLTQA